jgi:CRISPR-associated protein Csy3
MATKSDIKTASVLAFERKLDSSDALFYSGNWNTRSESANWAPIRLVEKSVRGTISNRLKAKDAQDAAKLDASIEKPNLQRVDVAALPASADTLKIAFTLKVLGGTGTPSACNSVDYQEKLTAVVKSYVENTGFDEIARRYAINIANGRFLWRNRIGAENIEVTASLLRQGKRERTWTFDATAFSVRNFGVPAAAKDSLSELAKSISSGLSGKEFTLIEVVAFARVGASQEVYPSQELILDKDSEKSKTLYAVNDIAGMHSQKIGNALRSIDTWYSEDATMGPIPVEPYGSVTPQGKAYRPPKEKKDFYTLLDNWVLRDIEPAIEQQHYVLAVLARGGVFGEAEK